MEQNDTTLHTCPRCGGTNEGSAGGFCDYPGCKNGQVDSRPKDIDFAEYQIGRRGE